MAKTTLEVEEAARAFGVSRRTAYDHAEDLGAIRVGRRVVFPVGAAAARLGVTTEELLRLVGNGNGANGS